MHRQLVLHLLKDDLPAPKTLLVNSAASKSGFIFRSTSSQITRRCAARGVNSFASAKPQTGTRITVVKANCAQVWWAKDLLAPNWRHCPARTNAEPSLTLVFAPFDILVHEEGGAHFILVNEARGFTHGKIMIV